MSFYGGLKSQFIGAFGNSQIYVESDCCILPLLSPSPFFLSLSLLLSVHRLTFPSHSLFSPPLLPPSSLYSTSVLPLSLLISLFFQFLLSPFIGIYPPPLLSLLSLIDIDTLNFYVDAGATIFVRNAFRGIFFFGNSPSYGNGKLIISFLLHSIPFFSFLLFPFPPFPSFPFSFFFLTFGI